MSVSAVIMQTYNNSEFLYTYQIIEEDDGFKVDRKSTRLNSSHT